MKGLRYLTSLLSLAALVLVASDASAVYYTFAGKFTSNRGKIINIPMVGDATCGGLTLMTGPNGMIPGSMGTPLTGMGMVGTPTMHQITRGANTQPPKGQSVPPGFIGKVGGMDIGCVGHVPGKLVNSTGAVAAVGGQFTLPKNAFFDPYPKYKVPYTNDIPAVQVKYAPPVLQLATSFKISGPRNGSTVTTLRGGTMATMYMLTTMGPTLTMTMTPMGAPLFMDAQFLRFRKGAHVTQTGRAGSMFTWCFGNAACTHVAGGAQPIIVKYAGGGNKFGGTMSYIINAPPGVSSLALGYQVFTALGPVAFVGLEGMGSQPTGRGYAAYLVDILMSGPIFGMHKEMNVTRPIVGQQKLVTMVSAFVSSKSVGTKNYNYGFPFTTRTVLARNTGTNVGNPQFTTITAKGYDKLVTNMSMGTMTGMVVGRNISLVAGSVAATNLPPNGTQTPDMASMKLILPEPGSTVSMLAGVIGLLCIAAWRSRRAR